MRSSVRAWPARSATSMSRPWSEPRGPLSICRRGRGDDRRGHARAAVRPLSGSLRIRGAGDRRAFRVACDLSPRIARPERCHIPPRACEGPSHLLADRLHRRNERVRSRRREHRARRRAHDRSRLRVWCARHVQPCGDDRPHRRPACRRGDGLVYRRAIDRLRDRRVRRRRGCGSRRRRPCARLDRCAAGALSVLVVPMPAMAAAPDAEQRAPGRRGLIAAHWRVDPRVWLAFLIALYINVLSNSVDTFFPLFGLSIGIPLAASGALKGLKSGAATFIRFISGAVFRFVDHRTVNFWSVLLFGATTIVLGWVSSLGLFFALFLAAGIARGLLRVTSAASIAELRAEGHDVGIASGVYNMGLDLGAIVGPAVGGLVGDAVGLGTMFQLVGVASLLAYFAVALVTPQGRAALTIGRSRPARAGS